MGAFISKLFKSFSEPLHTPSNQNNDSTLENTIIEISTPNSMDNIDYSDHDTIATNEYIDSDDENISLVEASDEDEADEYDKDHIFTYGNEKRALIIGINYINDQDANNDLKGCVNDMNNLKQFLQRKCYFLDDDIITLRNSEATRECIEAELLNLVVFSYKNPGSEIWLSYSGHGSNTRSINEADLKSEVICPSDYAENGIITDHWLQENFVLGLEKTTKVFALMDCCNSGSNLNLPYCLKYGDVTTNDSNYTKEELNNICNIIKISGCEDDQTSADYFERSENEFQGALTNGFLHFSEQVKTQHNDITFFYNNILSYLTYRGFTQRPLLTFSKADMLNIKLF